MDLEPIELAKERVRSAIAEHIVPNLRLDHRLLQRPLALSWERTMHVDDLPSLPAPDTLTFMPRLDMVVAPGRYHLPGGDEEAAAEWGP